MTRTRILLLLGVLLLTACARPTPQSTPIAVQPTGMAAATETMQPTGTPVHSPTPGASITPVYLTTATATSPNSTARPLPTPFPGATRPIRPDRRIALTLFRSEKSDVYLIHVDGTGLVNLTNDPIGAGAGGPSWSPDGQRIAFSSSRGGNSDIYTIHPDGSNLVQLTTSEQDEVAPRWSPDGKYMLFQVRVRPNAPYAQQYDIFVMATDGSNTSQIASGVNPVWSPRAIALKSMRCPARDKPDTYQV